MSKRGEGSGSLETLAYGKILAAGGGVVLLPMDLCDREAEDGVQVVRIERRFAARIPQRVLLRLAMCGDDSQVV